MASHLIRFSDRETQRPSKANKLEMLSKMQKKMMILIAKSPRDKMPRRRRLIAER